MQKKKKKSPEGLKPGSIHWKTPLTTSTSQLWMHQTLFSAEESVSLPCGVPPSHPAGLWEAQT